MTATLLAEKGVTGLEALFEGKYGIFNTYFAGKYEQAKILEGLGQDYQGSATLYKRWASVSTSHSHIHATIGLVDAARHRRGGHRRRSGLHGATGTT